uniref:Putative glycosyltransferase n=1 Tax=viral metagenome TaxID=1070528 RepID=A0A6M3XL42_9ZZZZ
MEALGNVLISVAARCLNEEELIETFIKNHGFADEIIISDGGSTDRTRDIVDVLHNSYPVRLVSFSERVPGVRGGWRNPEGKHVNFTIDQCKGDWIWLTEIDAIPSLELQKSIRNIVKNSDKKAVGSRLYYIAPRAKGSAYEHYPALLQGYGLTCWHKSLGLRADPTRDFDPVIKFEQPQEILEPPMARVHLSWWTEERLQAKRKFYMEVHGLEPTGGKDHPDKKRSREKLPEGIEWRGM